MDDQGQRRSAKAYLVALMQRGYSYQAATALAGLPVSQSTAYRLSQAVRKRGEVALQDGRHGHPVKLRGEARAFLEEQCRQAPHTPSSAIQAILRERFNLSVSISQINRVRAALGISNHRKPWGCGEPGICVVTQVKPWPYSPVARSLTAIATPSGFWRS